MSKQFHLSQSQNDSDFQDQCHFVYFLFLFFIIYSCFIIFFLPVVKKAHNVTHTLSTACHIFLWGPAVGLVGGAGCSPWLMDGEMLRHHS